MIDWELIILIVSLVILVATLVYIIVTLRKVSEHAELLRKQVFGEVYEQAQISDVQFYLPEKVKHSVEGFDQKEDVETIMDNCVTIPVGHERELHVRWRMAESQTLRSFVIGFDGEFKSKPRIVNKTNAFVKTPISTLPREEYIDYHGNYHCEYGFARRLPKCETFVSSIKVKGIQKGNYGLNVEIFVSEAPNPYKGTLQVNCE
ncbi:MAG: hypothetical protein HYX80_08905 [Chloroflexi bacterium]|nr:hypothetical protein [Chloroflexota bacterium]